MCYGIPHREGTDRKPEGDILQQRVCKLFLQLSGTGSHVSKAPKLLEFRTARLGSTTQKETGCKHQLSSNSFPPTRLLLTISNLHLQLQHTTGLLQKTVEQSASPLSSGPVQPTHQTPQLQGLLNLQTSAPTGKRRDHSLCYRTGDADLHIYTQHLEGGGGQSRRAQPASVRCALLKLRSCHTFPGVQTPGMSGWHP